MKITNRYSQHPLIVPFVLICMTVTGLLSPVAAYSDSNSVSQTGTTKNNLLNDGKTSNTNHNTSSGQNGSNKKKILIEDSRGLSAFFIFGIGINIIMVITFAWWFSSEWRKTKK